ncbi:MAG: hypothetical protein H6581_31785, partial [Bacteroidia bacterium]|nr:hypothetical protein [Bacteroidia bacterium]
NDHDDLEDKTAAAFKENFQEAYMRRVDIILGDAGQPEQWIELKSYKALSETGPGREKLAVLGGKTIGVWSLNKAVNLQESLHRQFSLDRAAANIGHARLQKTEGVFPIVQVESSFQWRFQRFRKVLPGNHVDISPQFGDPTKPTTIHGGLTQPIKHALTPSSRPERVIFETNMGTHIVANQHIKYGDLRTMLTDLAAVGFTEAAEALAEEVFIDN